MPLKWKDQDRCINSNSVICYNTKGKRSLHFYLQNCKNSEMRENINKTKVRGKCTLDSHLEQVGFGQAKGEETVALDGVQRQRRHSMGTGGCAHQVHKPALNGCRVDWKSKCLQETLGVSYSSLPSNAEETPVAM